MPISKDSSVGVMLDAHENACQPQAKWCHAENMWPVKLSSNILV